jgi:hypothetical protein
LDSKRLYFVILIFLSTTFVFADEVKYNDYSNSFGLKASNISGYGFYFNKKITDDFNLQVMGLAYYLFNQKENDKYTNFNYDIGLEFQRNMFRGRSSRAYLLAGAYYYYDDVLDKTSQINTTVVNHSFNVGVGVGYEIYYKRFVLGIDLGYKFFEDNKEITEIDKPTYPKMERMTNVGVGVGIGFTF